MVLSTVDSNTTSTNADEGGLHDRLASACRNPDWASMRSASRGGRGAHYARAPCVLVRPRPSHHRGAQDGRELCQTLTWARPRDASGLEVGRVDDRETAEVLLALGERPLAVGEQHLAVAVADDRGSAGRAEADASRAARGDLRVSSAKPHRHRRPPATAEATDPPAPHPPSKCQRPRATAKASMPAVLALRRRPCRR